MILRPHLIFFLEGAEEASKPKLKDRAKYEAECYAKDADDDENIIFEDFAKLRMSMSDIDNWTIVSPTFALFPP